MPAAAVLPRQVGTTAETRLNDLQADVEAGSRLVTQIYHQAFRIRDVLDRSNPARERLRSLLKQSTKLKACVVQQRTLLRELRHDIRRLRDVAEARRR